MEAEVDAMRPFRRLRQIGTLLRCIEAADAALFLVSWSSARAPAAARLSADFLRCLGPILLSRRCVFLLCNAIVLLLFAESHHPPPPPPPMYSESSSRSASAAAISPAPSPRRRRKRSTRTRRYSSKRRRAGGAGRREWRGGERPSPSSGGPTRTQGHGRAPSSRRRTRRRLLRLDND